ncbi:MAG: 50S ribosomal protein L21 [Pseudomonadota bacterium]
MYAVIKTGGKQYKVTEGDKLVIEKLDAAAGDVFALDQVLMLGGDDGVTVGSPLVDGAQVRAELVELRKGKKIKVFKKRRRQNYRRTKGHRQYEALIRIAEIVAPGAKAKTKLVKGETAKTEAPKAEAKETKAKPAAKKPAAPKAEAKPAAKKAEAAAVADDLTVLNGVGPAYAKKLAEAGVTSFAHVAAWTEADLDALEDTISGVKAKAEKGDWIAAAKDLAGK